MIFDGKPTRDITQADLRRLVTERMPEDRHLDYKEAPYPQNPHGSGELVKDVTAFANTDGGYLLVGVREDGARRAKEFVNVDSIEGVRRSIIDRCLDKIDPRITHLDIRDFNIDGRAVLVIRVPESDMKPHCAKPDAEHHYFWRRYEDGNKLMTPAEIRECFAGDRLHRELTELRREVGGIHRERVTAREATLHVDEGNVFALQTPEAFLRYVEQQFMASVGNQSYYRLFALPLPLNEIDLHSKRNELLQLLEHPPQLRDRGWDVTPFDGFQQTAIGLICRRTDYRHLRLLWNGHLEFWTSADILSSAQHIQPVRHPERDYLLPHAFIEPAVNFACLAKETCRVAEHDGEVRFGLGLYNMRGKYLAPYGSDTFGYLHAMQDADQPGGPHPYPQDHLRVGPVTIKAKDLPGEVAWQLVSQVYYAFGYDDDQIPHFDAQHQFTLGNAKR